MQEGRDETEDGFGQRVNVLAAIQVGSCGDSFGRLQLFRSYIPPWTQVRVTNCTVVTSQISDHVVYMAVNT